MWTHWLNRTRTSSSRSGTALGTKPCGSMGRCVAIGYNLNDFIADTNTTLPWMPHPTNVVALNKMKRTFGETRSLLRIVARHTDRPIMTAVPAKAASSSATTAESGPAAAAASGTPASEHAAWRARLERLEHWNRHINRWQRASATLAEEGRKNDADMEVVSVTMKDARVTRPAASFRPLPLRS